MANEKPLGLAERMLELRRAKGFGGPRQRAAFARQIGITPPSLHDIESGKSKDIGKDTLLGILRIGSSDDVDYLVNGRGRPMKSSSIETVLRAKNVSAIMQELTEEQQLMVEQLVITFRQSQARASDTDPFAGKKPPKK